MSLRYKLRNGGKTSINVLFYSNQVCNENKAVGEEIARLKLAIKGFKSAQTKSGGAISFNEDHDRCQQYLTDAVKDNEFIYHERVPDVSFTAIPEQNVS